MTAMPAARAAAGPCRVTSRPATVSVPLSGWCTPARIFTSVDLPAPFSPRSACTSPARSSTEPSISAWTAPNDFTACWSERATSPNRRPAAPVTASGRVASTHLPLLERFNSCPVVSARAPGVSMGALRSKRNRYKLADPAPYDR